MNTAEPFGFLESGESAVARKAMRLLPLLALRDAVAAGRRLSEAQLAAILAVEPDDRAQSRLLAGLHALRLVDEYHVRRHAIVPPRRDGGAEAPAGEGAGPAETPYKALGDAIVAGRTLTDAELDALLAVLPDHATRGAMAAGLYACMLLTRQAYVAAERRWSRGGAA